MTDRNLIDMGKKQIYGTQLEYNGKERKYKVLPIEDIEKINDLRKTVGLNSIEDMLLEYNLTIQDIEQLFTKTKNRDILYT